MSIYKDVYFDALQTDFWMGWPLFPPVHIYGFIPFQCSHNWQPLCITHCLRTMRLGVLPNATQAESRPFPSLIAVCLSALSSVFSLFLLLCFFSLLAFYSGRQTRIPFPFPFPSPPVSSSGFVANGYLFAQPILVQAHSDLLSESPNISKSLPNFWSEILIKSPENGRRGDESCSEFSAPSLVLDQDPSPLAGRFLHGGGWIWQGHRR